MTCIELAWGGRKDAADGAPADRSALARQESACL
jgi:hypothetical protein